MIKTIFKDKRLILVSVIFFGLLAFVLVIYQTKKSEKLVAKRVLEENKKKLINELDNFFDALVINFNINYEKAKLKDIDIEDPGVFNRNYFPVLRHSPNISSLMVTEEDGDEMMVLDMDSLLLNRVSVNNKEEINSKIIYWKYNGNNFDFVKSYEDTVFYDSRSSSWFQMAINDENNGSHWTAPYKFKTTHEVGLTLAKAWTNLKGKRCVLAYDMLMKDISIFLNHVNISKNGKAFMLSEDMDFFVAHSNESKNTKFIANVTTVEKLAFEKWTQTHKDTEHFNFIQNNEKWSGIMTYYAIDNLKIPFFIIAPTKDFLESYSQTRNLFYTGTFMAIICSILLAYFYYIKHQANSKLSAKNELIKNKNYQIQQSISYAQRLQSAILPSKKLIGQLLPNSFILYKPKDTVSGDFYLVKEIRTSDTKEKGKMVILGDCTGHGIPGSLMSMLCTDGLKYTIHDLRLTKPSEVLNLTRNYILNIFNRSDEVIRDGMDVAVIKIKDHHEHEKKVHIEYSGAQIPIWILAYDKEEIQVIKGDKQPIALFDHPFPFTNVELELNKGDLIYCFSDGIVDQFGGINDKKFKASKLKELLLSIRHKDMEAQKTLINKAIMEWKGDIEQTDDIAMIGIRL